MHACARGSFDACDASASEGSVALENMCAVFRVWRGGSSCPSADPFDFFLLGAEPEGEFTSLSRGSWSCVRDMRRRHYLVFAVLLATANGQQTGEITTDVSDLLGVGVPNLDCELCA